DRIWAMIRALRETQPARPAAGRAVATPAGLRALSLLRIAALWEAFRVAVGSLRSNKLRTLLTLVGVVVGGAAAIAPVPIIQGLNNKVASTFSSQGSTVFTISKNPQIIKSREEFVKFSKRKDVTHEDEEAIARLCSVCWRVGVAANALQTVKYGDQKSENV